MHFYRVGPNELSGAFDPPEINSKIKEPKGKHEQKGTMLLPVPGGHTT